MTVLITGGTGKTGSALAKRLHAANIPILIASRSGNAPAPFKGVTFNWDDPATYDAPFAADPTIDRVYLAYLMYTPAAQVKAFIEHARAKGVKRFVLLSASHIKAGDPMDLGVVHQYLIDSGLEYAVLRPTWFQQNFGTGMLPSIRDNDQTFSATGDGRIPFVSTEDIAEAAFEGLTAEPSLNNDRLIFGPQLLTHDEVAETLSKVLGRKITHTKLTREQLRDLCLSVGFPRPLADTLSAMERAVAEEQLEEKLFLGDDNKFVGKHTIEQYVRDNRDLWLK